MSGVAAGRNIVLGGLMGTGKSTIGRLLSVTLGRRWLDTDVRIQQRAGCSIPELFARDGERRFRELESAVVAEIAGGDGCVVSLGGGALLDQGNVDRLRRTGVIVLLTGDPAWLARRAASAGVTARPLLAAGDADELPERLARLADERRRAYEAAADHVEDTTDGRGAERVAAAIIAWAASRDDVLTAAERERVAA